MSCAPGHSRRLPSSICTEMRWSGASRSAAQPMTNIPLVCEITKAYSMGTAALSGLGSACRRRFRLVCRSFAGSLAGAISLLIDLFQWAGMRCLTHGACALGRVSHLGIAGFRFCCQGEVGIRKPAFRKADDFEMLLR